MSNNTSIMTPFTNIGGEASRYGGKNRMLKHWYEGKCFTNDKRQLGYALNKRDINVDTTDIYSQFTAVNPDDILANTRSQMNTSQAD